MTGQGSSYARFRLAIESGNPTIALAAAKELLHLSLADSFALLLALRSDRRYSKAGARWHALFVFEVPLTLRESQLVLAALSALASESVTSAVAALERTFVAHGRRDLGEVLLRWR